MTRPLRSARAAAVPGGRSVAVTGAATPVGRAVCRVLVGSEAVRNVVALDQRRPGVPGFRNLVALGRGNPGLRWRQADPTDPEIVTALHKVDVLVHLPQPFAADLPPAERRRLTTRAASVVLTAAAAAGVRRVVLVSSAHVYGALPDNPVPLPDAAPLRAVGDGGVLGDLIEVEGYARRVARAYPKLELTVLRPAVLIGPDADPDAGDTALGRPDDDPMRFVRGSRPHWQFCHLDDLAGAIELVVAQGLTGSYAVGSEGWLEQDAVEAALGRGRVVLPAALRTGARLPAPTPGGDPMNELSFRLHPWVVAADGLRAAGWRPAYSNTEALASYATGRRVTPSRLVTPKRAAAAGAAAGATVALVGAAALVARARRRKR